MKEIQLFPQANVVGMRVDAWLAMLYPDVSKRILRAWIDEGHLEYRGNPCSKGDRVIGGERYLLRGEPCSPTLQPNSKLALSVLYEDDGLIAVCKQAGINCHPNAFTETDTLANALLVKWPNLEGVGDSPLTCGILHRIDGGTSGLVLVAKTQAIYRAMREQFSRHTIEKHYRALVLGSVTTPGRLEHFLAHNPRCPGRMVDASKWRDIKRPMRAVSEYRPMHGVRVGDMQCTLLDVCIFTGVTHQIRAQLSFAGFPILGDIRYGGQPQEMPFPRHFLHAGTITFIHPLTGQVKTLKAPLTTDFQAILGH